MRRVYALVFVAAVVAAVVAPAAHAVEPPPPPTLHHVTATDGGLYFFVGDTSSATTYEAVVTETTYDELSGGLPPLGDRYSLDFAVVASGLLITTTPLENGQFLSGQLRSVTAAGPSPWVPFVARPQPTPKIRDVAYSDTGVTVTWSFPEDPRPEADFFLFTYDPQEGLGGFENYLVAEEPLQAEYTATIEGISEGDIFFVAYYWSYGTFGFPQLMLSPIYQPDEVVTLESLADEVAATIPAGGIRTALLQKLSSGSLRAFINQVEAQRGKNIPADDAETLIRMAEQLLGLDG